MSKVKDSFFGGAEKKAGKQVVKANRAALQRIELAKEKAVPELTAGRDFSLQQIGNAFNQAVSEIRAGSSSARADLIGGAQKAQNYFIPTFTRGEQSAREQANLLGLNGQKAADAALSRFRESPGQQFLREEGEKSVLRNAAARGQLQGGSVLRELTRFGTGLAAQDFDRNFQRLGFLTGLGFEAGGALSGIRSNLSSNLANLATNESSNIANLTTQQGGDRANIESSFRQALANLELGVGTQGSQIIQNIGQAKAAATIGQAQAFGNALRELASLVGGSGGFGVPSISEQTNSIQSIFNLVGSFAGAGGGGGGGLGGFLGGGAGNIGSSVANVA